MHVRIVNRWTGAAVAGARIERSEAEKPDLKCDAAGRCGVPFVRSNEVRIETSESGLPSRGVCRVRAEGYSIAEFRESEGHEREDSALEVKLDRPATLVVTLLRRQDLSAGAYEVRANAGTAEPLKSSTPTPELNPPVVWFKAVCDVNGIVRLEGLPDAIPLTLQVFQDGAPVRVVSTPVRALSGEEKQIEVDISTACRVRGRVIDTTGAPVAEAVIWLTEGRGFSSQFKEDDARESLAKATSDRNGRFDLGELPSGKFTVGPAPVEFSRHRRGSTPVAAKNVEFEVSPGEQERNIELRVTRGLSIRGVVLLPGGKPMNADRSQVAHVYCVSKSFHQLETYCGEDGSFEIGPLLDQQYSLYADGWDSVRSLAVAAAAGAEGIVLTLRKKADLKLRVVEYAGGPGVRAELLYSGPAALNSRSETDAAGYDHSWGFAAGRISVCATSADGRVGVIPSLELLPGKNSPLVEIVLAPGARLRGHSTEDKRLSSVKVFRGAMLVATASAGTDGTFTAVVPPGDLSIRAYIEGGEEVVDKSMSIAAGQELEVVFQP